MSEEYTPPPLPAWAQEMADQPATLGNAPLKEAPPIKAEVPGFTAAGGHCGLKANGRPDLALIAASQPVPAAGVFTQNRLQAAPVQVARRHLAGGRLRAVLANSGGANAATGRPGLDASEETCRQAAAALGCRPQEIAPCSTGVVGQLLDAAKIAAVLPTLAAELSPKGLSAAAGAIMTTDSFAKLARADTTLGGRPAAVVGLAKGAGMIRPDMATMLAFVLSDAAASPAALAAIIGPAAELSFNRATVDGDTSPNDTLLLLASGRAGGPALEPDHPELPRLGRAVAEVCQALAAMMVADGEGASHLVRVLVSGAADGAQARRLCYAIAHSPLCKTAFFGRDPNWGRLLSAAGAASARAGLPLDPGQTRLWIGEALIADGGLYTSGQAEKEAAEVMARPRYQIRLDLGQGTASHWVLTSDLGTDYVGLNADYRS